MAHSSTDPKDRGISAQLGNLADGFSRLVAQHLALARLELAEDVKVLGKNAAMVAAFIPFVLIGYVFLCVGIAAWVAQSLGWAAGFAIVGGVHLVLGGVGIALAVSRLKGRAVLDDSMEEIQRSASVLSRNRLPAVSAQAAVEPSHVR